LMIHTEKNHKKSFKKVGKKYDNHKKLSSSFYSFPKKYVIV
jgi:hypothetical protein